MFAHKNAYEQKLEGGYDTGLKRKTVLAEEKVVGKWWCNHCETNFASKKSFSDHNVRHSRVNVKCNFCNDTFATDEAKSHHELLHTTIVRCFNINCRKVGSLHEFRNGHLEVSCDLFNCLK